MYRLIHPFHKRALKGMLEDADPICVIVDKKEDEKLPFSCPVLAIDDLLLQMKILFKLQKILQTRHT